MTSSKNPSFVEFSYRDVLVGYWHYLRADENLRRKTAEEYGRTHGIEEPGDGFMGFVDRARKDRLNRPTKGRLKDLVEYTGP